MRENTLNKEKGLERTPFRWFLVWASYLGLFFTVSLVFPLALTDVLNTPYPLAAIVSNSMWPAIKAGDIVIIKGVQAKTELKAGDVIVYDSGDGFIIHRIIRLGQNDLVTKGDANEIEDEPIRYSQIIGKAVANENGIMRIPFLGNLAMFLNNQNP